MTIRDTPWPAGVPCWQDLATTDPDDARTFYGDLFGWQFDVGGPETGNYSTANVRGQMVAGIGPLMNEGQPVVWTTYLATTDIDATAAAAAAAGSTVIAPPMDVMQFGRLAVIADPTGGVFGLWQAGTHMGTGLANETGAPIWNEYVTPDLERAKEFYAEVFGYSYQTWGSDGPPYVMVEVDGRAVASLGQLPADLPVAVPAHWRLYIAVDDADATVDRAVALGGTVTQPAADAPFGRFAGVADRQGASLLVVQPPSGSAG
jgi:predicted enzyme related to lactoylglutathione lyase